jgi:hypothetical protein
MNKYPGELRRLARKKKKKVYIGNYALSAPAAGRGQTPKLSSSFIL